MDVSVVIATCGAPEWAELAWSRAFPSAAEAGPREILIDHYPDLSVPMARNALAQKAVGRWLCFLDADDELDAGYFAALEPSEQECVLLVPSVEYVRDGGATTPAAIPNRGRWPEVNECVVGTLIERDLFVCLGGFRDLPSIEDYDLFLRAYDDGTGLVYVPTAVYRAFVAPGGGRNADQSVYGQVWSEHLDRIRT